MEQLFEDTGLKIRRNANNQFCVVTLHYTADPERRSESWKKEAMAGMPEARWMQEQEIDYGAMFGTKVFPQISTHRANIVVPRQDEMTFPKSSQMWGGFDFGIRNPSSFHVYTWHDQRLYAIWELYKPCENLEDFCFEMTQCPYWEQIKYIFADPHIWDRRSFSSKGTTTQSVGDQFRKHGVRKLVPSSNDEEAWLSMMHQYWGNPADPIFKIYSCCPQMIQEFESAAYPKMTDRQMLGKNFKEKIADVNNHAMDDCKYFMLSGSRLQQNSFKNPRMVEKWL
jgi:hypothetical protein